jgi:hypothetical protein
MVCNRDQAEISFSVHDAGVTRSWQLCGPCLVLEYRGEVEEVFAARLARVLLERDAR